MAKDSGGSELKALMVALRQLRCKGIVNLT